MATVPNPLNRAAIARFFDVLTLAPPNVSQLDAMALRVDNATATLGSSLKEIFQSPSVANGPADDLARMFFLVFDRAPDALLFSQGMALLRGGSTLQDLAAIALSFPGHTLSNGGFADDSAFLETLITRTLGSNYSPALFQQLEQDLTLGRTTRAELLALASSLNQPLAVASTRDVNHALLFLASGNTEASRVELDRAGSTLDAQIIASMRSAGMSATAGKTAISIDGPSVILYSDLNANLSWDLAKGVFKLGASSSFSLFYSPDQGVSGAVAPFDPAAVRTTQTLDASLATGSGKVTFTGQPDQANIFLAPAAGSTATGGARDDVLTGHNGADTFYASAGRDRMTGGFADDRFVLGTSNLYTSGDNTVTITDFGNGKDVLDFSRLLNKTVDVSKLSAILATDTSARPFGNGAVVLIENNGAWVTGSGVDLQSRAATATDVAALFGPGKPLANPSQVLKSVVITADTVRSADVWLILNSTDVGRITDGTTASDGPREVFHVAELEGAWNTSLVGLLPVSPLTLLGE